MMIYTTSKETFDRWKHKRTILRLEPNPQTEKADRPTAIYELLNLKIGIDLPNQSFFHQSKMTRGKQNMDSKKAIQKRNRVVYLKINEK
jgi:hypothetical protein